MAAITRVKADARATNDITTLEITMDVVVEAGQLVYIKANGKGALANAGAAGTMKAVGVATMDCPIGRAVALATSGKFGGWTGMTPGAVVFASATPGEIDTAAGTVSQRIGVATSATDIYINLEV
jgi:hypothetical protein